MRFSNFLVLNAHWNRYLVCMKAALFYESITLIRLSSLVPQGTGGRIIFVSSTNYRSARVAQAHVCAAKAGVNALSDCISLEYGPKGITSNIIAPGPIDDTEGMRRLLNPDSRREAMRSVPLQRFGLIKEIADATVFLFADTGNFVNGACLDVDGGAWRVKVGSGLTGKGYPDSLDEVPKRSSSPSSKSKL